MLVQLQVALDAGLLLQLNAPALHVQLLIVLPLLFALLGVLVQLQVALDAGLLLQLNAPALHVQLLIVLPLLFALLGVLVQLQVALDAGLLLQLNALVQLLVALDVELLLWLNAPALHVRPLNVVVLSLVQYFLLYYGQIRATRKNLFFLLPLATKLLALNHGAITLTILKIIMKSII